MAGSRRPVLSSGGANNTDVAPLRMIEENHETALVPRAKKLELCATSDNALHPNKQTSYIRSQGGDLLPGRE
jgi:hypothetical protein